MIFQANTRPDQKLKLFDLARLALATVALALIFNALLHDGANSARTAADLGMGLAACAGVMVFFSKGGGLLSVVRSDRISAFALAAFVGWAILTTLTWPSDLAQPIYRELGLKQGAGSIAPYRVWEGLAALSVPVMAFVIGGLAAASRADRDRIGLIALIGGFLFLLAGFTDYFRALSQGGARLTAGVGANGACTVAAILATIGLGDIFRHNNKSARPVAAKGISAPVILEAMAKAPLGSSVLALALIAALFTQSRAGLAACFIAILFQFVAFQGSGDRGRWRWTAIIGVCLLLAFAALAASQIAVTRGSGNMDEDFASRFNVWSVHWDAFLHRPITGYGLNSFHEINAHTARLDSWSATRTVGAAHNIYIQALEETGLIGAVLWVAMLAPPIARAVRALGSPSSARAWSGAALAAALACGLHGLVDFGLQIPAISALFAFVLGAFARPLPMTQLR